MDLRYEGALRRVMGLADFERSRHSPGHSGFHLERMRLLMERLGGAHVAVPTVHVAGTKGKGSTSAMVASILGAEGYRVGMYSSPHLHSARERIRVDMEPIGGDEFAGVVERIWDVVEWVGREGGYGGVSTFEAMTAMAFVHFADVGVDFQVIEVGLGGRLDATNIVEPLVCAITSISLDHMATLGDTVGAIAFEKAGIIKRGVPVVVAPQVDEARDMIAGVAEERGARVVWVGERFEWEGLRSDLGGQAFRLRGGGREYELELPLLGDYQMENAATAVGVAEALRDGGVGLDEGCIVRGIGGVRWDARLQVLGVQDGGALVVVDGAHNPYSMGRLVGAVRAGFGGYERVVVVFGALGGHSAVGMLEALAPLEPLVVAVSSRHPRAASSEVIAGLAEGLGLRVVFRSDDVGEGVRRGLGVAEEGDLLLGTGSLSVAAEVIEEVRGIPPETYPYMRLPGANRDG